MKVLVEILIYENKSQSLKTYDIYYKLKSGNYTYILRFSGGWRRVILPTKSIPSLNYFPYVFKNMPCYWYLVCENKKDYFKSTDERCIYSAKYRIPKEFIERFDVLFYDSVEGLTDFCTNINDKKDRFLVKDAIRCWEI